MNVSNVSMEYVMTAATVVGGFAFVTAVIVQTVKELPGLSHLPTNLVALVTAEAVTICGLVAYSNYSATNVLWYHIASAVICGFMVYMVATGGWEKLNAIWQRTKFTGRQ